jgi:hypothetical protein
MFLPFNVLLDVDVSSIVQPTGFLAGATVELVHAKSRSFYAIFGVHQGPVGIVELHLRSLLID